MHKQHKSPSKNAPKCMVCYGEQQIEKLATGKQMLLAYTEKLTHLDPMFVRYETAFDLLPTYKYTIYFFPCETNAYHIKKYKDQDARWIDN